MAERVQALAHARRFNAKTLGEALKIPSSSAANYWSGKRPWPLEVVPILADLFDTNVDFLLRGTHSADDSGQRRTSRENGRGSADVVELDEYQLAYGMGASFIHDGPVEANRLTFSRSWLRNFTQSPIDHLFFARGIGDSMMPTILDNDIVLIDTAQHSPRLWDQLWAIDMSGMGMIKRLRPAKDGGMRLLSDNQAVPEEVAYDGEMNIIGRVVAIVRKT